MKIKNQTKRTGSYIILLAGVILFIAPFKTAVLFNKSDSLPHKIYFLAKGSSWEKGDLVAIKNFTTSYTKDQHFTKKIVGVAGDVVTIEGEHVLVNGIKHARLKGKTKSNKKLTPTIAQTIPQQYFFVIAEQNDSFDSRYQEFGLVRENYIEGKVYPIW